MIDDLIERAFTQEIVRSVVLDSDGCDEYLLDRAHNADPGGALIAVWVRPDGRFSRAVSTEGLLSLGQVMTLCGLEGNHAPATPPTHSAAGAQITAESERGPHSQASGETTANPAGPGHPDHVTRLLDEAVWHAEHPRQGIPERSIDID